MWYIINTTFRSSPLKRWGFIQNYSFIEGSNTWKTTRGLAHNLRADVKLKSIDVLKTYSKDYRNSSILEVKVSTIQVKPEGLSTQVLLFDQGCGNVDRGV